MKNRYYLNNQWKFGEAYTEDMKKTTYDDSQMQEVRIPHTCKELPFHYFDENDYQMLCGYRKIIEIPKEWEGKQLLLTFEGVAHACEVYVNEMKAAEHFCGYTAFTLDITSLVNYGKENVITVRVDSRENLNIPPFGNVIDYLTYGGIYRDVYMEVKEENYLEEVFLHADIPNIQINMQRVGEEENRKYRVIRTSEPTLYTKMKLHHEETYFTLRQTISLWKHSEAYVGEEYPETESKEFLFENGIPFCSMDAEIDSEGYFHLQWKL